MYIDLESDRNFARNCMPFSTSELNVNGVIGWSYNITCAIGNAYSFFLYFDGSRYQVKCVFPDVEYPTDEYTPIDPFTHLFPDGRLCLDPTTAGSPSIGYAYSKSVLWATGFSIYKSSGIFPFTRY